MSLDVASCPGSGAVGGMMVVSPAQNSSAPGLQIMRCLPETTTTNNNNNHNNNNNMSPDKTALIIKLSTPPSGEPVGKGKRGPSGPIVTTSDEDECPDSPRDGATGSSANDDKDRTLSPPMAFDHDYDNINSPGNSSTASGPTYVRQPGFTHHAHEVTVVSKPRVKKKKTTLLCVKDGLKRREPTPPRNKPKRDPVPMRMRALPQSFWQQPNVPQNVSPAMAYPILPPLVNSKDEDQISDVRPITPPPDDKPDREKNKSFRCGERKITVANTDLLFKLFEGVEKDIRKTHPPTEKEHVKSRAHRTRKVIPAPTNKALVSGEDPYLVDGVTEKLFPELRLEQTKGSAGVGPMSGTSLLHIVTLKEGDRSITLPSLSVEQNYPQMLSELVAHI